MKKISTQAKLTHLSKQKRSMERKNKNLFDQAPVNSVSTEVLISLVLLKCTGIKLALECRIFQ